MTRILFVCHGNICRSPMAEFIMKAIVKREGVANEFVIESAAAQDDELGNDMYPPAKAVLREHEVPFERRQARLVRRSDYLKWDYIIAMDEENLYDLSYILGGDPDKKVKLLMTFSGEKRAVSDPWYTRDFEKAYSDIKRGCEDFFAALTTKK